MWMDETQQSLKRGSHMNSPAQVKNTLAGGSGEEELKVSQTLAALPSQFAGISRGNCTSAGIRLRSGGEGGSDPAAGLLSG